MQRIKAESKTAGGIILPDSAVKELNEAKVLAVGPGRLNEKGDRVPMTVAAGDRVLIPQVCREMRYKVKLADRPGYLANVCMQFGGSPIKVGEDEYSLFRDHE